MKTINKELPYESFSSLSKILVSVAEYKNNKLKPFKGNSSTQLGSAIHHYLQGNHQYVGVNPFERRSKEGKIKSAEFEEEFRKEHGRNAVILTKSQFEVVFEIYTQFITNKKVSDLLKQCDFETELWYSPHESFNLKGYLDGINVKKGIIVEIKTSSYVNSLSEFRDSAYNRHYDMQAALYKIMAETIYQKPFDHYFIVATTRAPHQIFLTKSSETFLKSGEEKLFKSVKLYDKHILQGIPQESEIEEM